MSDPMRIRAKLEGDVVDVRVLMRHVMETGQRREEGKLVPAHFIQTVNATSGGKNVFEAHFGPAVSKDPILAFKFKGAKVGDKVQVTWIDNKGDKRTDEAAIA